MMWNDDMAGLDDYLTTDPRDEWEEEPRDEAEEEQGVCYVEQD